MIKIVHAYRIPPNLHPDIEATHTDTWAKVRTPDGEMEEFDILAGVLQGDILSPFLFIIFLDYALRKATNGLESELGFIIIPRRSTIVRAVNLTDLDFADDICLCNKIQQAHELLTIVENECSRVGLACNARRLKLSSLTWNNMICGRALKEVSDFKYLGS